MDCEGAEYPILEGIHDDTLRRIDRIAMEWHRFDPSHEPDALVERFLSVDSPSRPRPTPPTRPATSGRTTRRPSPERVILTLAV